MRRSLKSLIPFILLLSVFSVCFAADKTNIDNIDLKSVNLNQIDTTKIQGYLEEKNIDLNNVNSTQLVQVYEQLLENYSNDEIASMIEENSDKIQDRGISQETINAGTTILKSLDEEQTKKILQNENVNKIVQDIQNGASTDQVVETIKNSMTLLEKISLALKIILASYIFKYTVIGSMILLFYKIIIRWVIYCKAGKHGFAAIIPIYREITMLQVCQLSPWLLLFAIIPIIGWLLIVVIKIMSRFRLAQAFGRSAWFGCGLLFFRIIFESIIAISSKVQYTGIDE